MADDLFRVFQEIQMLQDRVDMLEKKVTALAEEQGKELEYVPAEYKIKEKSEREDEPQVVEVG